MNWVQTRGRWREEVDGRDVLLGRERVAGVVEDEAVDEEEQLLDGLAVVGGNLGRRG